MARRGLTCPHCGGPIINPPEGTPFQCRFCGNMLDLEHTVCPECGLINPEGHPRCGRCGATLVRTCPACNEPNWVGNEHCSHCGRPLDLLEIMTHSRSQSTRAQLEAVRRQAPEIKRLESAQAEARMAQFQEMERQRLEELAQRESRARRQERVMLGAALVAVAVFLLIVILLILMRSWLGL